MKETKKVDLYSDTIQGTIVDLEDDLGPALTVLILEKDGSTTRLDSTAFPVSIEKLHGLKGKTIKLARILEVER